MTGLNGRRVYLDWNATAPLRPEARTAMLEAMDVVGNPSSVHAEGRAAKKIIEKARGQVAALVRRDTDDVVFTSGATEAIALLMNSLDEIYCAPIEHDCVWAHLRYPEIEEFARHNMRVDPSGQVSCDAKWLAQSVEGQKNILVSLQAANSETGVCQQVGMPPVPGVLTLSDTVQWMPRMPADDLPFQINLQMLSAHKMGGPKGIGALIADVNGKYQLDDWALITGGGQEQGRRSGTENVIGIAGFGAAAEAAQRDLEAGVWEPIEKLRNILEERLATAAPETIFFGQESPRLPNTSCFAVPGWRGETQVMQMDLAGFAVSAGSACSSGKVNKASRVLKAMGFDEITASSAIRVSMGQTTTEAEVMAFADTWIDHHRRRKARAA